MNLLQREFPDEACPIRTALVTARSAPAHERVIRTLRDWDIRLDESLFLGGLDKSAFLRRSPPMSLTIRLAIARARGKLWLRATFRMASVMSGSSVPE